MRRVVVLPQPLGPSIDTNSPCTKSAEKSMTAWVSSPKVLDTLRRATSGQPDPVTGSSPSASFSTVSGEAGVATGSISSTALLFPGKTCRNGHSNQSIQERSTEETPEEPPPGTLGATFLSRSRG